MSIKPLVIIILSIIGGLFKIIGGLFFGSKALTVDALTSIANILAAILIIYYYNVSLEPPDIDHMYGHYRLTIGGPIFTVAIYSGIFGVVLIDLIYSYGATYVVSPYAPVMAIIGALAYMLGILLSRTIGGTLKIYARFTGSELIESLITIISSLFGAYISYIIDFSGAVILSIFILYGVYISIINMISIVSDETSRDILLDIERELKSMGIENIERIRVRRIIEDIYHGDIIIRFPGDLSIQHAHDIVDRVERYLKSKYNIDIIIHIEPR